LKTFSLFERHIFLSKHRIDIYTGRSCSDLFYGGSRMNRPPSPATLSAKRTRRPGQNLRSLAPGPRGAVLLPVIPKIPQSQSWILVKRTDVPGEGGKNFTLHHFLLEVLHRPYRPNRGNQIQLANCDARKHRKIKHQNGRERPHFLAFNPPKKFSRSLPPVLGFRQQARFARKGSNRTPVERAESSTHEK
jgi:hypothetical protein